MNRSCTELLLGPQYDLELQAVAFCKANVATSNITEQIACSNAECVGNFHNGINRRGFFTSFDLSDIVVVQLCLFRKLLLAHVQRLSAGANRLAEDFAIFSFECHHYKRKQERQKTTTVLRLYFLLVAFGQKVKVNARQGKTRFSLHF